MRGLSTGRVWHQWSVCRRAVQAGLARLGTDHPDQADVRRASGAEEERGCGEGIGGRYRGITRFETLGFSCACPLLDAAVSLIRHVVVAIRHLLALRSRSDVLPQ